MNFFGHASLAALDSGESAFVFGSMLPDFASITRARFAGSNDANIEAGVAHHHKVDAVFHATDDFVLLCDLSAERMLADGVRRGTARAVAHIGVELLLDGWLQEHRDIAGIYLEAIQTGVRSLEQLRWKSDAPAGLPALLQRLVTYGTPDDFAAPEVVSSRLRRALAPRKRLAILEGDEAAVDAEVQRLSDDVRRHAPSLYRDLREGLNRYNH